jgi:hypothetical protein
MDNNIRIEPYQPAKITPKYFQPTKIIDQIEEDLFISSMAGEEVIFL